MQNGFQDTHTATASAALEVGAMRYAAGLIDHQWANFVRYDGMINYRAEEVAQSGRMLTLLALYHSYSADTPLLLRHFEKARARVGGVAHRSSPASPHCRWLDRLTSRL